MFASMLSQAPADEPACHQRHDDERQSDPHAFALPAILAVKQEFDRSIELRAPNRPPETGPTAGRRRRPTTFRGVGECSGDRQVDADSVTSSISSATFASQPAQGTEDRER